jgi:hypothetical protein
MTVTLFSLRNVEPVHFSTKFAGSATPTTTVLIPASTICWAHGCYVSYSLQGSIVVYITLFSQIKPNSSFLIFKRQHSSAWVFPGSSREKPVINRGSDRDGSSTRTAPTLYAPTHESHFIDSEIALSIHLAWISSILNFATWLSGFASVPHARSLHMSRYAQLFHQIIL